MPMAEGYTIAITQASLSWWGRNRAIRLQAARSTVNCRGRAIYNQFVRGSADAVSEAVCRYLWVIPPPTTPKGKLLLDGVSLQNQRLPKGKSLALRFQILGERLRGLQIQLFLKDLSNRILLSKQVLVAPGGVLIEEIVDHVDGNQLASGAIQLLANETIFAGSPADFEVKYFFEIGNGTTRQHQLDAGYLIFTSKP
ncbi:MAG TPA: hypothetical protein DCY88_07815 [Cyanobacteria bacterium UBA11372]|nr:hypothetical protein [Cyanobacteria bacterium UBA11372]